MPCSPSIIGNTLDESNRCGAVEIFSVDRHTDEMLPQDARTVGERYTLVRQLGGGGMGIVYEAIDRGTGRHVALKTMRTPSGDALRRFKQEFRSLQDIHHPNLITLGDLFVEGEQWWFSMELVWGVNFLAHVRSVSIPIERSTQSALCETAPQTALPRQNPTTKIAEAQTEAGSGADGQPHKAGVEPALGPLLPFDELRLRDAIRQLAQGLHALHQANKVHRDVKPDNVLVNAEGRVIILDFGLVGESHQLDSAVIGTVAYMAPEQASGRPAGPAADWYSVGVLLYEALSGRIPFDGKVLEILTNKQRLTPQSPSTYAPNIPTDLEQLCMDLLRVDPTERPDFAEIIRRLQGVERRSEDADQSGRFFVGRTRELDVMSQAFDAMRGGRARVLLLHGESGVGKSALMQRFAEQARAQVADLIVLHGRCYEHETVPFKAVDGLIDGLAGVLKRWPRAKIEAVLPRKTSSLLQAFPVLGSVQALAELTAGPAALQSDPHEQRSRVFSALRELFGRISERRPLLLLIDDLQWTDADSLALLGSLVRPPDEPAVMIIATVRIGTPVLHNTWLAQDKPTEGIIHLTLQPLSKADALTLAKNLVRSEDAHTTGQLEILVAETRGHPLFVQELIRYSIQHKSAEPPRLDEALWSRICQLSESAQEILYLCTVMGLPLSMELLVKSSSLDSENADRSIRQLRAAYLVRASTPRDAKGSVGTDSLSIEPYHDRIREAVFDRLTPVKRKMYFQRLARTHEGVENINPEVLVHLFEGAGDQKRAGTFAIRVADNLMRVFAFERAAVFYGKALDAPDLSAEFRRALLIKQSDALANAGRGYEAAGLLVQAADGASIQQSSELRRRAGEQFLCSGYYDDGVALIRRAFQDLGLSFRLSRWALIVSFLFHHLWLRVRGLGFQLRPAADCSSQKLAEIDLLRASARRLGSMDVLFGADVSSRWLLKALQVGEPSRVASALSNHATATSVLGTASSWDTAMRELFISKQLMETINDSTLQATLAYDEGLIFACAGEWAKSCRLFEKFEQLSIKRGGGISLELAVARSIFLDNLYYLGMLGDLRDRLLRYLDDADSRQDRFYGAFLSSNALPIIHLMRDRSSEACQEAYYRATLLHSPVDNYLIISRVRWKAVSLLYDGHPETALQCRMVEIPNYVAKSVKYTQKVRVVDNNLICLCMLSMAIQGVGSRPEILKKAIKIIRAIKKEGRPWSDALACNLQAVFAHAQGDVEQAATQWATAASLFDSADMALHAAIARRRQGQVWGGDTGRALVRDAEEQMRRQGIANPARWTAVHAPATLD